MLNVEPGYAEWLKSEGRFVSATPASAGKWSDMVITSRVMTPLINRADARAIAELESNFLAGPLARDVVTLPGLLSDTIGQVVHIIGDRAGYEAGADVYVIGAAEADRTEMTTLTVLKRL